MCYGCVVCVPLDHIETELPRRSRNKDSAPTNKRKNLPGQRLQHYSEKAARGDDVCASASNVSLKNSYIRIWIVDSNNLIFLDPRIIICIAGGVTKVK